VIVVGYGAEHVRELIGDEATFVLQEEQLGTGHAVMQAREVAAAGRSYMPDRSAGTVLVLYGDTPLITVETLQRALAHHRERGATITLLSFYTDDPTGYGRIVRDEQGTVTAIVEHKDATEEQRAIQECNSGIMFFDGPWLWESLDRLTLSPRGEYYLTDLPALAVAQGRAVLALVVDEREVMGINNRAQLAEASAILSARCHS
ncbi:MAG: sugar phosphate nucleotidyltransferase, partial [Ardenticatenaceae bacterium]